MHLSAAVACSETRSGCVASVSMISDLTMCVLACFQFVSSNRLKRCINPQAHCVLAVYSILICLIITVMISPCG